MISSHEYKQILTHFLGVKFVDVIDLMNDLRIIVNKIESEAEYYAVYPNHNLSEINNALKNLELKKQELQKNGVSIFLTHVPLDWKELQKNNKRYFVKIYTDKQDITKLIVFKKDKKEKEKEPKYEDIITIFDKND